MQRVNASGQARINYDAGSKAQPVRHKQETMMLINILFKQ